MSLRSGKWCGASVLLAALALLLLPASNAAAGGADRGEALDRYMEVERAKQVGTGWTGSIDQCRVGSESGASLEATLTAVNVFRKFAGLQPVTFDAAKNDIARSAALAMAAAGSLSHDIDSSWPCHSDAAEEGAARSNLALGRSGAGAIEAYLDDAGVASLGHRRWLLNPGAVEFGSGSVPRANALYVIDSYGDRKRLESVPSDSLIAWPPPGWVPWPWVFEDWSATIGIASANAPGVDRSEYEVSLSGADVEVSVDGEELTVRGVRKHDEGYGAGPMLSWRIDVPNWLPMQDRSLEVSIGGVTIGGEPADLSYAVDAVVTEETTPEGHTAPGTRQARCERARRQARGALRIALRARRVAHTRQRQARRTGSHRSLARARLANRSFRRSVVRFRYHRQVARRVCRGA